MSPFTFLVSIKVLLSLCLAVSFGLWALLATVGGVFSIKVEVIPFSSQSEPHT